MSKPRRERPIVISKSGNMRRMSVKEERTWRKRIKTVIRDPEGEPKP